MELSLSEIKHGDEVVSIQFFCGHCDGAVDPSPIRVNAISRSRIMNIAQSACSNPECRRETDLNYPAGKEANRGTKLKLLCEELEKLRSEPDITGTQLLAIKTIMEGRNLKLRFEVKRAE